MHHSKTQQGLTLVEMLVVAPIVILFIGAFIGSIVQLTGQTLAQSSQVALMNNLQSTLDEVESDVKMSGAFLAVNNFTLSSPQGYDNATQSFTNTMNGTDTLILNTLVTDKNPTNASRSLVYLANMPNACGSANFGQNQVMTMNVVYFVKNNTLWRRTLAVNGYTSKACSGATIWQLPSCAPGISGALCLTTDEKLMTVSDSLSLAINYYDNPADTTPLSAAKTGTDNARQSAMDTSKTIDITISATNTAAGRQYTKQGSLRVSRTGSLVKYATPSS